MAKKDFLPLLSAGIHKLTMSELEDIAVKAFPTDVRRTVLFTNFSSWINHLNKLGITGTIWIDGSFITEKPSPDDIDCFFFNVKATRVLSVSEHADLNKIFDHNEARALFDLDLYIENPLPQDLIHRQAYWSGFFGFQHDRSKAKGFVELSI